jgi:uncharacterized OB-fold protein
VANVPVVDYLSLDDPPHLRGHRCEGCGAVFLQRHNGCAKCSGRTFEQIDLSTSGIVRAFTIVHRGKRGDPFVSAVVELDDGTIVKSNLVGVPPEPEEIPLGGRVELVTYSVATDSHGTEAIAFGFRQI